MNQHYGPGFHNLANNFEYAMYHNMIQTVFWISMFGLIFCLFAFFFGDLRKNTKIMKRSLFGYFYFSFALLVRDFLIIVWGGSL